MAFALTKGGFPSLARLFQNSISHSSFHVQCAEGAINSLSALQANLSSLLVEARLIAPSAPLLITTLACSTGGGAPAQSFPRGCVWWQGPDSKEVWEALEKHEAQPTSKAVGRGVGMGLNRFFTQIESEALAHDGSVAIVSRALSLSTTLGERKGSTVSATPPPSSRVALGIRAKANCLQLTEQLGSTFSPHQLPQAHHRSPQSGQRSDSPVHWRIWRTFDFLRGQYCVGKQLNSAPPPSAYPPPSAHPPRFDLADSTATA